MNVNKGIGGAGLLSINEAAEFLNVSRATVYALMASGELPHVLLMGRIKRIPKAAVVAIASKTAEVSK